jgi:hypothetical protein
MEGSIDRLIGELPTDVGKEVFKFIIPESNKLVFRKHSVYSNNRAYNPKYEVAFVNDRLVKSEKGPYLSRIWKKNGKHRYYLTNEVEEYTCDGCGKSECRSQFCRGGLEYTYYYESKYVGKNVDVALIQLLC